MVDIFPHLKGHGQYDDDSLYNKLSKATVPAAADRTDAEET